MPVAAIERNAWTMGLCFAFVTICEWLRLILRKLLLLLDRDASSRELPSTFHLRLESLELSRFSASAIPSPVLCV
jgi:hypothetical protein